jgi:hypothetical protein
MESRVRNLVSGEIDSIESRTPALNGNGIQGSVVKIVLTMP